MTEYFPLFVDMNDKEIRVFGGGAIALRRVKSLLSFGARVTVVSPEMVEELEVLASQQEKLNLEYRRYRPSELEEEDFVLAATDDRGVNDTIYRECHHKAIPVNVASDKEKCDFYFPGIVKVGDLGVGVTAQGRDHRKAAEAVEKIRELLLRFGKECEDGTKD